MDFGKDRNTKSNMALFKAAYNLKMTAKYIEEEGQPEERGW